MTAALLLLEEDKAVIHAPQQPVGRPRRFTVWGPANLSRAYRSVQQLAEAARALLPAGDWDEVELLLKAGEGGSWQSMFDSHPLAPSGAQHLATIVADGAHYGVRITPYVVVRGRTTWVGPEQDHMRTCAQVAGSVLLNVEPGAPYWNGPNDPGFIRGYIKGTGLPKEKIRVCLIPRQGQVNELGGAECIAAWTDSTLVGGASWETYGVTAGISGPSSLLVNEAIPRLDGWGVSAEPQYRIPVVQRSERHRWAETPWCAAGMEVWYLDGD